MVQRSRGGKGAPKARAAGKGRNKWRGEEAWTVWGSDAQQWNWASDASWWAGKGGKDHPIGGGKEHAASASPCEEFTEAAVTAESVLSALSSDETKRPDSNPSAWIPGPPMGSR